MANKEELKTKEVKIRKIIENERDAYFDKLISNNKKSFESIHKNAIQSICNSVGINAMHNVKKR